MVGGSSHTLKGFGVDSLSGHNLGCGFDPDADKDVSCFERSYIGYIDKGSGRKGGGASSGISTVCKEEVFAPLNGWEQSRKFMHMHDEMAPRVQLHRTVLLDNDRNSHLEINPKFPHTHGWQ